MSEVEIQTVGKEEVAQIWRISPAVVPSMAKAHGLESFKGQYPRERVLAIRDNLGVAPDVSGYVPSRDALKLGISHATLFLRAASGEISTLRGTVGKRRNTYYKVDDILKHTPASQRSTPAKRARNARTGN